MHIAEMSRRRFLARLGAAASLPPLPVWMARLASGQTPPMRVRHEASSADGRKMLGLYSRAVGLMKAKPMHHPHSWRFQANIHDYPDNDAKEVFPHASGAEGAEISAHRALALGSETASGIWRTCKHNLDLNFLPWHRLYLAYFEQIIESILEQPFAVPYWDYTTESCRHLPGEFFSETVAGVSNPLFFKHRIKKFLNDGIVLQDLKLGKLQDRPDMFPTSRDNEGFSRALEFYVHRPVHTTVGNKLGMAEPMYAARDPIFWLHHATIDRIWETWRDPNGDGVSDGDPASTEAWYQARYSFVDARGTRRDDNGPGFVLRAAKNLGCRYDSLARDKLSRPSLIGAGPSIPAGPPLVILTGSIQGNGLTRADDTVRIAFSPSAAAGDVLKYDQNAVTRYFLILTLRAMTYPGLYRILTTVKGAEVEIGAFSLFAAGSDHHPGHPRMPETIPLAIDVTAQVRDRTLNPVGTPQIVIRADYLDDTVDIRVLSSVIRAQ